MRQYDVFQSKYTAEQIEKGLDNASPQIGENGNWYVWDILSEEWVDTGVVGRGSHYEITEEDYEEIATITEGKLQPKIVETIHLKSDGNTIWLFDDEEETPLTYLQVKAFIENEKNIVYLTNGNYSFYNKYKYFPQGQSNAIGFVGETQLDGEVYSYRIVINSNDEVKSDEIQLAKNQDLTNKADKTEVNELKEDIATKADKTALAKTDRSLDMLWKLNQGITYTKEESASTDYEKQIPSGALGFTLDEIGGMSRKGYQLIKTPLKPSSVVNGVAFDILDNHKIHIHGTPISGNANYDIIPSSSQWSNKPFIVANTGTFSAEGLIEGVRVITSGSGDYNGFPYTELTNLQPSKTASITYQDRPLNYITLRVMAGYTVDCVVGVMVEIGSVAHPYEPYFDGLKNAIVSQLDVKGVNLVSREMEVTKQTANIRTFNPITNEENPLLLKAGTYSFAFNRNATGLYVYKSANGERTRINVAYNTNKLTFTLTEDTYAVFDIYMSDKSITASDYICVVKGSNYIYKEYEVTSFPIPTAVQNLPLYGVGISDTVCNKVSYEKQTFKNMKSVDLGTLDWEIVNGVFRSTTAIDTNNIEVALCSKYGFTNIHSSITTLLADKNLGYNTGKYLCVRDDNYTTVAEFKESLNGVILHCEATEGGEDYEANLYTQMCGVTNTKEILGAGTLTDYSPSTGVHRWNATQLPTFPTGIKSDTPLISSEYKGIKESERNSTGIGEIYLGVSNKSINIQTGSSIAPTVTEDSLLVYELATPLIYDITDILEKFDNSFECEANGSITFKQTDEVINIPVPNKETFVVKVSEVV